MGDLVLYKIGFSVNVFKRMSSLLHNTTGVRLTLLACYKFPRAVSANCYEVSLHKKFKQWRYGGKSVLKSGNSELYIVDVLGLDG